MKRPELAARLLAMFVEELEEQLRSMSADLLVLEAEPGDAERLKSLFRSAHTLKGAARAAGVPGVAATCHALEAMLERARDGRQALGSEEFARLFAALDEMGAAAEALRGSAGTGGTPPAAETTQSHFADTDRASRKSPRPAAAASPADRPERSTQQKSASPAARARATLRVEGGKIDALLASAGEINISAGRIADWPARIRRLREDALRGRSGLLRLTPASTGTPEDEATRRTLGEVADTLRTLADHAGRLASEAEAGTRALARTAHDQTERARALTMRPFREACENLPRVVRDLSMRAGKSVDLAITGGDIEADRAVLDALREALLHLVRNAVDHGIERPEERKRRGKPTSASVLIAASLRGDRLQVTVTDDGGGFDIVALGAALRGAGREPPDDPLQLTETLFHGGITTRAEATEVSGRGVGLDAVRAAVERVRGSARVAATGTDGTAIVLDCPLSLAVLQAVLVRVGSQTVALPMAHVERLLRVSPADVTRMESRDAVGTPSGPVPLLSLARLLGPPLRESAPAARTAVAVLRTNAGRVAVTVDELVGEQEVLVRPLGPTHLVPRHVVGAALLQTGELALLLHAPLLVESGLERTDAGAAWERADAAVARRILVADDSITTRTLEESVLEASGYEVVTAADGAEAWRILLEQSVDLVVSDVEMPRMDGFALCEAIRASKRMERLPVVLVTALDSEEHRTRGMEVGADAYITKSSFDQQTLLDVIQQLLA